MWVESRCACCASLGKVNVLGFAPRFASDAWLVYGARLNTLQVPPLASAEFMRSRSFLTTTRHAALLCAQAGQKYTLSVWARSTCTASAAGVLANLDWCASGNDLGTPCCFAACWSRLRPCRAWCAACAFASLPAARIASGVTHDCPS